MQDHNTTESSCQDLEGALCSTHARVQQRAESKVAGRRLVSKSDVKGESCLPRSCIQEPGLRVGMAGKGPHFFRGSGDGTWGVMKKWCHLMGGRLDKELG